MKKIRNNRMRHLYQIESISAKILVEYLAAHPEYTDLNKMPYGDMRDLAKAHRYFSKYRNNYVFEPLEIEYGIIQSIYDGSKVNCFVLDEVGQMPAMHDENTIDNN